MYLTALMQHKPTSGPAITFTGLVPDLHHYKGSFGGRVFPLWADAGGREPNLASGLVSFLADRYATGVTAEDVFAYLAGVTAHPAYTARFQPDLTQPGLRIPLTASAAVFAEVVAVGREVVWLHTFGERFADPAAGRPAAAPRISGPDAPMLEGAIPTTPDGMPDELRYDAAARRLWVGRGYVANVPPAVWDYEVSGKQVLVQWFSYRRATRERPLIGDRRKPSRLGEEQAKHWLAEYTTELLAVLHVLARLVALEPRQAALLDRVCAGPTIPAADLAAAGVVAGGGAAPRAEDGRPSLF